MNLPRTLATLVAVLLALLAAPAAFAGDLGDPAPPLKIAQWMKGEPVDLAARRGKGFTVVEMWATWCGPCKASIPHLTELQKKFKEKGVVFVGISTEDPAVVKPFVEKMGDKMDYAVAVDDHKTTYDSFMKPFALEGIPEAFVIGAKGEIAWHGHPLDGLEEALDQMTAGTYDIEATKRRMKVRLLVTDYLERIRQGKDDDETKALGARALADGGKDAGLMNELAWFVLTDPRVAKRDLDLALKAAQAAVDASEGKDPAILDTYARALCDTGKVAEAIATEKKAIEGCKDDDLRKSLEEALQEFETKAKGGAGGDGAK